ncbi:MAG: hypothetical protein NTY41_02070 [Proteobacteria bacterium]|nr:hypothetical protein [Pseudomonadota bacterium]
MGIATTGGHGDEFLLRAQRPASQPSTSYLIKQLENLAKRFDQVVADWRCILEDVLFVRDLSAKIVELVRAHPEICLGMAGHLDMRSQAIAHDFQVAVVATLAAQAMDLSLKQQLTVVRAALAMNLSSFEMHDNLAYTSKVLTLSQRINIARHPLLAGEYLAHSPGADMQWIDAVEQHHESMDGTGYPFGLAGKDICVEARVIKAADLWCALVSPRANRLGKYPHHAMQELQSRERMRLDTSVLASMRRRLGNYPPGTLVRLASRETAVVTGFAPGNAAPRHVVAIFNPAGEIMALPKLRDTGKTAFALRGYTNAPQSQTQRPDWEKVWSLVHSSLLSIPKDARVA